MNPLTLYDFDAMRNVNIRTVDPATLVDIRDTKIDVKMPFLEKSVDYINQIRNPFCFTCDGITVKICHSKTETSINDCMEGFIRSLD